MLIPLDSHIILIFLICDKQPPEVPNMAATVARQVIP